MTSDEQHDQFRVPTLAPSQPLPRNALPRSRLYSIKTRDTVAEVFQVTDDIFVLGLRAESNSDQRKRLVEHDWYQIIVPKEEGDAIVRFAELWARNGYQTSGRSFSSSIDIAHDLFPGSNVNRWWSFSSADGLNTRTTYKSDMLSQEYFAHGSWNSKASSRAR